VSARVEIKEKDMGWDAIQRSLKKLNNSFVDSGLWGEGDDPKQNMAYLGLIHEFGVMSRKIPQRSFVRTAFDINLKSTQATIKRLYDLLSMAKVGVDSMLEQIGKKMKKDMRKRIESQQFVPLRPATIRRKGKSTILIETGKMYNSIQFKKGER